MNALALLCLVPAALGVGAGTADLPAQALLEMRIFQAEFAGGETPDLLSATYTDEINTYELDIALSALETKAAKGEEGAYELPGLGTLTGARVLSAPRIISEGGLEASIRTAPLHVPIVETIGLSLLWHWKEEGGSARLEMKADVYGRLWRGIFDLRPGESAVLAGPSKEKTVVVVLTFRPLGD
jgi:hypothetical protein